ncbi:MAG TPA: HAD family hydrolase [Candidatus Acidoferrales bacterium]|jgi:phosphoglycolate phosphatase|nr:HAD family hydrolase [Candidatus Acidoferrales bacterium]
MSPTKKNETKNEIKGVLFDWDGTLLDSFDADSSAYLAMFSELGVAWGLEELSQHYSPNWYDVYRAAGLPKHHWDAADVAWRKHYSGFRPKLIPGARKVLTTVGRRYKLGLVTSGDRDRVLRQLREFRISKSFHARVCSGDTKHKKPHPGPLNLALRCIGLEATQCVYVGDSPEDVQMAKSAHVRAIGVLGPFPTEKRLRAAKPDLLLNSLAELPAALKQLAS